MKKNGLFIPGTLAAALVCGFVLAGCPNDCPNNTDTDPAPTPEAYSIVGTWHLRQSNSGEIVFTNYGVVRGTGWYYYTYCLYTLSGTTLHLSPGNNNTTNYSGTAVFSNAGNTLTISGFDDSGTTYGYEGSAPSKGPPI